MDMMKMMKQAADLQKNLKKKQKDLAKTNIQYELNGVKIEMSCEMKIKSIEISDELLGSNDRVKIETTVSRAFQGAIDEAQEMMKKEMGSLTKGMNLPGNMKLPF